MAIDVAQAWKSLSTPLTKKQSSAFLARIDVDFSNEKESEMLKETESAFAGLVTAVRVDALSHSGATAKLLYNYGKYMLERLDPLIDPDAIAFCNYHILYAAINYWREKPKDEPDLLERSIQAGEEAIRSGRLPPLKRRVALITLVHLAELDCINRKSDVAAMRRLIEFTERADREGQFNPKAPADRYPVMTIARTHAMAVHQLATLTEEPGVLREAMPAFERYLKTAARQEDPSEMMQAHMCLADANHYLAWEPSDQMVEYVLTAHDHYLKAADLARTVSSKPAAAVMSGVRRNTYSAFRGLAAAIAQEQTDLPRLWGKQEHPVSISEVVKLFGSPLPADDEEEAPQDEEALPSF